MSLEETLKDLLKDLIKCPVCHEYPSKGPLLHCPNGHHVCQNCHPKIDTCPVCRADGMTSRSLLADGILGVIPLPCQFNINGCPAQNLVGKTRESHQSDCDFRDVNCPKCNDPVKLPDFLGHINQHNLVTIRFDEKSEFGFIPFVIPIPVDNSNGSNGENQDENETESNDENPDEAESNDENPDEAESNDENDAIEFEDANNSEDDTNEIENSDDIDINEFEEDIDGSEEDIDESEEDIDENEEDSDDIAINEFEEDIDESEEDIYENEEDSDDIAINEFEEDIDESEDDIYENEEDSDDIAIDEFEEEIDENEESDITENDTDDIDIEESEDANNGDDDTDDNENSNDIEDANNGEDDTDEDDDTGELNINSFGNIQDFLQELVNRVNHHIEFHLHDHDHPDEDNESDNNDDEEPFDVDPIHVSFKEWHFFVMVKRDPKSETFHFWIYILGSPKEADKFSCQLEFQLDEAKKCTFDFPVVSMDVPSVTVVSRQSSLDLKQDFVKKGIVNGELPLRCKVEEKKRGRKRAAPDYDDDQ